MIPIAVVCAAAGVACIVFAFLARESQIEGQIKEVLEKLNAQAAPARADDDPKDAVGIAEQTKQQSTFLGAGAEYVKALGELAASLSKVPQAIAALLIATIFLAFAGTLVTIDHFDNDEASGGAPISTSTTTAPTTAGG